MILLRNSNILKQNLSKINLLKTSNYQKNLAALAHYESEESKLFWEKNDKLKRPISPFMIYSFPMSANLSITHRITGLGLTAALYGFGISQLLINNHWGNQLTQLESISPLIFTMSKFFIVGSFYYHSLNGLRHIAWDLGKGYQLKQLYLSGYIVLAFTAFLTAITMMNV